MNVFNGDSIYNAPSIYESGAGGGGSSEGENGAGSVDMPEGFTRLLYFESDKLDNLFRCEFSDLKIDYDCDFLFSLKIPNLVQFGFNFYPVGFIGINSSLQIGFYQSVNFELSSCKFFDFSFSGIAIPNVNNSLISVRCNKNGIYINDQQVYNLAGPFYTGERNNICFPYQLGNDNRNSDCQIYKMTIKKGDVIKYDCLPVKNDDNGEVGFLELVNNKFYKCDHSIAGPMFPY